MIGMEYEICYEEVDEQLDNMTLQEAINWLTKLKNIHGDVIIKRYYDKYNNRGLDLVRVVDNEEIE